VVIGGNSDVDRATLGRIAEASLALEGIQFEYWTNRSIADMRRAVRLLPEGTVILLSTVLRDMSGQTIYMAQLAQMLAPSARVPVYVLGGWVLGSGAVAGRWWILKTSVRDQDDWRSACSMTLILKCRPSRWRRKEPRWWIGGLCNAGTSWRAAYRPTL